MGLNLPVSFFQDEVRLGFYIPTAVKQAWAANLAVLFEIDRICEKYGISYFADWGSVLGAVRHGGYVPWDDDLDICMKRDDYVRFREVAEKELPEEFAVHDFRTKENHRLLLARVVNSNQISFDEAHLKSYHNFPYISVVDIFILDYLYKDPEKERERCEEVKRLIAVADGLWEGELSAESIVQEVAVFEKKYVTKLRFDTAEYKGYKNRSEIHGAPAPQSVRELSVALYSIAEQQMMRAPKDDAERVGQIFPWIMKGRQGQPKAWYENSVRLPFECMTIPVPECYNETLKFRYGDYLVPRKVWGGHNYPYFEGQRKNLQQAADFALPEFTFSGDMLLRPENAGNENSLKKICLECIGQLKELTDYVTGACIWESAAESEEAGAWESAAESAEAGIWENTAEGTRAALEDALTLLPDMQQLAVDFGTLTETVKGENRSCTVQVVDALQKYCDAVFELDGAEDKACAALVLRDCMDALEDCVNEQIINRREVLFLATGAKQWKGFSAAYSAEMKRPDTDIFVVALPVMFKDVCGKVNVTAEELVALTGAKDYPEGVEITDWQQYVPAQHMPERVYVQDSYEAENPCLTIPPQFYTKNVLSFTDEVVYIPAFKTGEFSPEDINDVYNLKHYVTAPGVIHADRVLVQSENIRARYIEKLTEFAGPETKETWETKVQVSTYVSETGIPCGSADESGENTTVENAEANNSTEGLSAAEKSVEENNTRKNLETETSDKKKLLFCIGLNEVTEIGNELPACLKSRMDLFERNASAIDVSVVYYPFDLGVWEKTDNDLTKQVREVIRKYSKTGKPQEDSQACETNERFSGVTELQVSSIEELRGLVNGFDAYYGSPSPLVPEFSNVKKPVMVADFKIEV